jgi:hypothetical protein
VPVERIEQDEHGFQETRSRRGPGDPVCRASYTILKVVGFTVLSPGPSAAPRRRALPA